MQYLKRNNLKVVEDLKIQVALLVHTISSKTGTEKSKATQTESNISWVERAPMHNYLSCVGEIVSLVPKHTEYNWGLCKKKFTTKKKIMQHRKIEHENFVSECKQNENGLCRFRKHDCWFKNNNQTSNSENRNFQKSEIQYIDNNEFKTSEIMGKLFNMMEAFAERMPKVENQMKRM